MERLAICQNTGHFVLQDVSEDITDFNKITGQQYRLMQYEVSNMPFSFDTGRELQCLHRDERGHEIDDIKKFLTVGDKELYASIRAGKLRYVNGKVTGVEVDDDTVTVTVEGNNNLSFSIDLKLSEVEIGRDVYDAKDINLVIRDYTLDKSSALYCEYMHHYE